MNKNLFPRFFHRQWTAASRVARFRATLANPNRCAHTSSLPHLATAHRTRRSLARETLLLIPVRFVSRTVNSVHVRATRIVNIDETNVQDKDRASHVEKTRKLHTMITDIECLNSRNFFDEYSLYNDLWNWFQNTRFECRCTLPWRKRNSAG